MNTIFILGAGAWSTLFAVRCFTRIKVLRFILYYPLCALGGGVVSTGIIAASPLAPFADTYVQQYRREFANSAATITVTQAASYLKAQAEALLGYKEDLEKSGITNPDAHANFVDKEEALAKTNTLIKPTPPEQP
jgi:hypothetical protein